MKQNREQYLSIEEMRRNVESAYISAWRDSSIDKPLSEKLSDYMNKYYPLESAAGSQVSAEVKEEVKKLKASVADLLNVIKYQTEALKVNETMIAELEAKEEKEGWISVGANAIAEERRRQIEVEKWDYKHDADYKHGELIGAATCYAMSALNKLVGEQIGRAQIHQPAELNFLINNGDRGDRKPQPARWVDAWPWDAQWDKRKKHDAIRSLEIAGALIAAQIDLLQPKAPAKEGEAEQNDKI